MPSEVLQARSRLGVASRLHGAQQVEDARRDLAAAKLADYVARVVADAPPLTSEQRHRIAQLLAPHVVVGGGR